MYVIGCLPAVGSTVLPAGRVDVVGGRGGWWIVGMSAKAMKALSFVVKLRASLCLHFPEHFLLSFCFSFAEGYICAWCFEGIARNLLRNLLNRASGSLCSFMVSGSILDSVT
jgi:hypothetical protein